MHRSHGMARIPLLVAVVITASCGQQFSRSDALPFVEEAVAADPDLRVAALEVKGTAVVRLVESGDLMFGPSEQCGVRSCRRITLGTTGNAHFLAADGWERGPSYSFPGDTSVIVTLRQDVSPANIVITGIVQDGPTNRMRIEYSYTLGVPTPIASLPVEYQFWNGPFGRDSVPTVAVHVQGGLARQSPLLPRHGVIWVTKYDDGWRRGQ